MSVGIQMLLIPGVGIAIMAMLRVRVLMIRRWSQEI